MKKLYSQSDHARVFKSNESTGPYHSMSDHGRVFKPHAMGGPVTPSGYSPAARSSDNLPNSTMKKGGAVRKKR